MSSSSSCPGRRPSLPSAASSPSASCPARRPRRRRRPEQRHGTRKGIVRPFPFAPQEPHMTTALILLALALLETVHHDRASRPPARSPDHAEGDGRPGTDRPEGSGREGGRRLRALALAPRACLQPARKGAAPAGLAATARRGARVGPAEDATRCKAHSQRPSRGARASLLFTHAAVHRIIPRSQHHSSPKNPCRSC